MSRCAGTLHTLGTVHCQGRWARTSAGNAHRGSEERLTSAGAPLPALAALSSAVLELHCGSITLAVPKGWTPAKGAGPHPVGRTCTNPPEPSSCGRGNHEAFLCAWEVGVWALGEPRCAAVKAWYSVVSQKAKPSLGTSTPPCRSAWCKAWLPQASEPASC